MKIPESVGEGTSCLDTGWGRQRAASVAGGGGWLAAGRRGQRAGPALVGVSVAADVLDLPDLDWTGKLSGRGEGGVAPGPTPDPDSFNKAISSFKDCISFLIFLIAARLGGGVVKNSLHMQNPSLSLSLGGGFSRAGLLLDVILELIDGGVRDGDGSNGLVAGLQGEYPARLSLDPMDPVVLLDPAVPLRSAKGGTSAP